MDGLHFYKLWFLLDVTSWFWLVRSKNAVLGPAAGSQDEKIEELIVHLSHQPVCCLLDCTFWGKCFIAFFTQDF